MKRVLNWMTDLKKECSVCAGSGKIPCTCNDNYEIACPNCNGKGVSSRRVTASQKFEVPCDHPQCQKGKVPCGVCNGTGKTPQGESCSHCQGSGRVNCPVCKGLGRVERVKQESWLEHETCHICNGRGLTACPYCHGTKERTCPDCKGTGKVLNTGKIAVMAVLAVLLLAVPVLFVIVAGITLGGVLFTLWKEHQEKQQAREEVLFGDDDEE
ncbi:MAG: hypothetical protein IKU46_09785 [Peptococcaceae bacterium]|nr:hypothetical protein [Peptococcaceae bacterium]